MIEPSISKPLHKILFQLTGEPRFELALQLATKDLLRLKLMEAEQEGKVFTNKYSMTFDEFKRAWESDQIPDRYSYEVEKDFHEWEATQTDSVRLREMLDQLP